MAHPKQGSIDLIMRTTSMGLAGSASGAPMIACSIGPGTLLTSGSGVQVVEQPRSTPWCGHVRFMPVPQGSREASRRPIPKASSGTLCGVATGSPGFNCKTHSFMAAAMAAVSPPGHNGAPLPGLVGTHGHRSGCLATHWRARGPTSMGSPL